jgi:hypothetical protein
MTGHDLGVLNAVDNRLDSFSSMIQDRRVGGRDVISNQLAELGHRSKSSELRLTRCKFAMAILQGSCSSSMTRP